MKIAHFAFAAATAGAIILLAPIYGPHLLSTAEAAPAADDLDKSMKSVASAFALIEKNYADPVSSEHAFYDGAIPGMLHTLDPHSNFVTPNEYKEMQRRQQSQYYGVGMQITVDNAHVVVMEPFPDSPAFAAGMRRGDVIYAVDGKRVDDLDVCKTDAAACSSAVAERLRGPKGTPVQVSVMREGASQPYTATITRGGIATSVVDAFYVKPGIAYLGITSFEAQSVSRDAEALLAKMGEQNVKGMVLDLRNNLGGLVNEAVSIAGRFLRNGQTVVSHRGRAEQEQVFKAKGNPLAQNYPIVVLVNSSSASASEIVSGALQDHDRAWIMGETTFGKGLVQAQFPLTEGAALLLTIAHYYTPSGRLIQRDYSHGSFFDYYYARKENIESKDIQQTDSGRKVFGGGGITPDEKYANTKSTIFQRRMGPQLGPNWFYRFANAYFGERKPELPQGWQPDDAVVERFHAFLKEKQVPITDEEFAESRAWVRAQIRWEFYYRTFGKTAAERAKWQDDPEVLKAIESLPKAQNLMSQAQKAYALK